MKKLYSNLSCDKKSLATRAPLPYNKRFSNHLILILIKSNYIRKKQYTGVSLSGAPINETLVYIN